MSDDPDLESWDSDPDFLVPPEGIRLPSAPSASSLSLVAASPSESDPRDFFSLLDSKLSNERAVGRARDKDDSLDSLASAGSTVSSAGTLKGAGGGLATPGTAASNVEAVDGYVTAIQREEEGEGAHVVETRASDGDSCLDRAFSKMQTIRLGSDLSKLLSGPGGLGSLGRGTVAHLGSPPPVQVGKGDWDQDLDFGDERRCSGEDTKGGDPLSLGPAFGGAGTDGRTVEKKASWTSHLSIDDDQENDDEHEEDTSTAAQLLETTTSKVSSTRLRQKVSIDSFQDDPSESDQISDLDFELPSSQSIFDLTPSLSLHSRPSLTSLTAEANFALTHDPRGEASTRSTGSKTDQIVPPPLSIAPNPSRLSVISNRSNTTSTSAMTTTDDEGGRETAEDSDAEFFQDLELPAYFLGSDSHDSASNRLRRRGGGGGTTTPPTSDGEFSFPETSPSPVKPEPDLSRHGSHFEQQQQTKIDLQGLLKQKLEIRGGRGMLFRTSSGSSAAAAASPTQEQLDGLEKHREREDEEHEAGKELSLSQSSSERDGRAEDAREDGRQDEEWNADEMRQRMRTISGVRAREAATARAARSASGRRRPTSASGGNPPPLPSPSTVTNSGSFRRPLGPRRSETAPSEPSTTSRPVWRSALSRSSSTASVASQPDYLPSSRSSLPLGIRPSSVPSSVATSISTSSAGNARRGPPPAPSTASRDRIRLRTTSLRTVGSLSDVRASSSSLFRERRSSVASSDPSDDGTSSTGRSHHPPRTASSPGPASSIRPGRSQHHLRPSTAPNPARRTIERKRSLQNIATGAVGTPARPSSRQNSLRSPSPATSINRRPSFAAPTAASASRTRPRVHSNPQPLASIPASPVPSRTAGPPLGSGGQLLRPTLASASKARPSLSKQSTLGTPSRSTSTSSSHGSAIRVPSQPLHLLRPLDPRGERQTGSHPVSDAYGDGTELDGFDDLPVSKEREKTGVVGRKLGNHSTTNRPGLTSDKTQTGTRGIPARRVNSLVPVAKNGSVPAGQRDADKLRDKGGKKKKREPHLIRHLGGNSGAPKVQGEMTYNAALQRWEGNESILREFDNALSTSTRPALISPFTSSTLGSPARAGFVTPPTMTEPDSALPSELSAGTGPEPPTVKLPRPRLPTGAASRGGVKVVGDMVFDPSTCSWHAIAGPEGEDELELDWGDIADDEHGGGEGGGSGVGSGLGEDGWARGENERMLKNRASFILSEGEEGSSADEAAGKKGKMTKRGIWRESKRAEERCREEMKGWITHVDGGEEEDRSWMFELRAIVCRFYPPLLAS
ncbi:hypothetical protein JCM11491_005649 [Sporobolomyces phaffii]